MSIKSYKSAELRKRPDHLNYVFILESSDPRNGRMRLDLATGWDNVNKRASEGKLNGIIACDLVNSKLYHVDMKKLAEFMKEWRDNHGNPKWVIDPFYFTKREGDGNGTR